MGWGASPLESHCRPGPDIEAQLKVCALVFNLKPAHSSWTQRQLDRSPASSNSGVMPERGKLTSPCTLSSLQALLGLLAVT